MKKEMNILFVCRYNRFRSRIAKEYFDKINKNKNIKTKSVGLIKGNPLNKNTVNFVKKKFNLDIRGKTNGLTSLVMAWQNITVIVANDVSPQAFNKNKRYGKKVIVWRIKDSKGKNDKEKEGVIKEIIKRINTLVKQLK